MYKNDHRFVIFSQSKQLNRLTCPVRINGIIHQNQHCIHIVTGRTPSVHLRPQPEIYFGVLPPVPFLLFGVFRAQRTCLLAANVVLFLCWTNCKNWSKCGCGRFWMYYMLPCKLLIVFYMIIFCNLFRQPNSPLVTTLLMCIDTRASSRISTNPEATCESSGSSSRTNTSKTCVRAFTESSRSCPSSRQ